MKKPPQKAWRPSTDSAIKKDLVAVKAMYIESEMSHSLEYIRTQKEHALNSVKLYFTVLFAFFAFASFVLSYKIDGTAKENSIINNQELIKALYCGIGVTVSLILFSIGWALLSHLTNIFFFTIIQHKHESNMRKLKADRIGDTFRSNCILPITEKFVERIPGVHVPILFAMINYAVLSTNYWFISIINPSNHNASFNLTMLIVGIASLFYLNATAQYVQEIAIAQITNGTNKKDGTRKTEEHARKAVKRLIVINKRKPSQRRLLLFLVILVIFFASLSFYNLCQSTPAESYNLVSFVMLCFLIILLYSYVFFTYYIENQKRRFIKVANDYIATLSAFVALCCLATFLYMRL